MLKTFGYPVVFINESREEGALVDDAPVFQLISNSLLVSENRHSLASYLLPPYWNRANAKRYPLLFNGYYDANENTFSTVGPSFLEIIGKTLASTGQGVVGILWNGEATSEAVPCKAQSMEGSGRQLPEPGTTMAVMQTR